MKNPVTIKHSRCSKFFLNQSFLIFLIAGLLLTYSPHFRHYDTYPLSNTKLNETASSKIYTQALIISLVINIPLVLDLIVDAIDLSRAIKVRMATIEHWFARILLLCCLAIPNAALLRNSGSENQALLYTCTASFRQISGFWCILYYMMTNIDGVWSWKCCNTLTGTYILAQILGVYSQVNLGTQLGKSLGTASMFVFFIPYLIFLYMLYKWLSNIYKRKSPGITPPEFCGFVYVGAIVVVSVGVLLISFIFDGFEQSENTGIALAYYTYLQIFVSVSVTVLPGRSARIEVANVMNALDSKRSFVRYVSHEIRTPMNTILLGLQFLNSSMIVQKDRIHDVLCDVRRGSHDFSDDTKTSQADECEPIKERIGSRVIKPESVEEILATGQTNLDTLSDIRESCEIAINILNDLLAFDKLETGIMTLDQRYESANNFFQDSVKPFYVQARQANVRLRFIYGSKNSDSAQSRAAMHRYFIYIDRFKLSQVVRNLVSNALKFSKPNSDVNIRVYLINDRNTSNDKNNRFNSNTNNNNATGLTSSSILSSTMHRFLRKYGARVVATDQDVSRNDTEDSWRETHGSSGSKTRIRFEVEDFGPGIAKENQHRIFKEVVQFNAQELQGGGGSGFGLWIANGIIKLHQGRIGLRSEGLGHGCTFYFDLPCCIRNVEESSVEVVEDREAKITAAHINFRSALYDDGISSITEHSFRSISLRKPSGDIEQQMSATTNTAIVKNTNNSNNANNNDNTNDNNNDDTNASSTVAIPAQPQAQQQQQQQQLLQIEDATGAVEVTQPSIKRHKRVISNLNELNILIVDDSSLNRKMLMRMLVRDGFQVCEADDGDVAIDIITEQIRNNPQHRDIDGMIDLILLDFIMVRVNGPAAAKTIRDAGFKGIIVGLTGNALQSDITYFVEMGANFVLTKPLDMDMFREALKRELSFRNREHLWDYLA